MHVLAAADLMFGARIQQAAVSVGANITAAPRDGDHLPALADEIEAQVAVLDLTGVPDFARVIQSLKAAGGAVVGFCGHAEVATIDAARAAGIDEVLAKGEVVHQLSSVLRALMDTAPGLRK